VIGFLNEYGERWFPIRVLSSSETTVSVRRVGLWAAVSPSLFRSERVAEVSDGGSRSPRHLGPASATSVHYAIFIFEAETCTTIYGYRRLPSPFRSSRLRAANIPAITVRGLPSLDSTFAS
jgi:hypothetical protein